MLRRRGHGGAAAGERRRRCSANRVANGPIILAQKEARGSRVLTEGLRWTELRHRVVVGEVRAVVAGGARGEGRCRGWSGVQWALGSSRRRGGADAQLGRAPVRRSDGNTAAQRSGVGRSWWRRLLGFTAARGMDGMRGSAGRFKGASAGISASALEFGRPASVSAGISALVARGRRRCSWARVVSGCWRGRATAADQLGPLGREGKGCAGRSGRAEGGRCRWSR